MRTFLFNIIKMKKLKLVGLAIAMACATPSFAGGLLTNTNQHVAFNRMMSREASIGIDGVYYNPAGVVFMGEGHHLAINWQLAYQTRSIENDYALFKNNVNNSITPRTFKGKAFAPVIPSFQYAYNKGRWSLQASFALTGGGGKCTFDNGLGSFEKVVANIGLLGNALAPYMGHILPTNPNIPNPVTKQMGGYMYSFDSYMHGRQYYFGLSLGAAYKVNEHLAVALGVRGVYATCNYYGYVENIAFVGNEGKSLPLSSIVDKNDPKSSDIELNTNQSGIGFTPIIGIDYKTGRWNFSAKYEFKTRLRLKNQGTVISPVGKLNDVGPNLLQYGVPAAALVQVAPAIAEAKNSINELIAEYDEDQNKKVAGDIPSLLTIGAGYSPIDALRINVGFHWFDDKNATSSYSWTDKDGKANQVDRNKKLKRGTLEYNAGIEYDLNKKVTLSTGWQNTNYGLSDEYMDDKSFVTSSNSVAVGGVYHINKKMDLNVAYFHTFYQHKKTTETDKSTSQVYSSDYTRNNNVFAVGLDINF